MGSMYGFSAQKRINNPAIILDKMFRAIPSPCLSANHQWTTREGLVGLGTTYPAKASASKYYAEDLSSGMYCIFDGIIYRDNNDLNRKSLVETDGAAFLLEQYQRSGTNCLRNINGSFNVAWWDEKAHRLILANDKLGHNLLFLGIRDNILVFASMLARIMATGILSSDIDIEGFADLLNYGYILGERTLFKDIHVLPPASFLIFEGGKVCIKQYWHLNQVESHGRYDKQRLDELENTFKLAVKRSILPDKTCAIDLTGGLDSRCILAAAVNQRLPFITHTGGQPDTTDVVIAKRLSAQIGVQHCFESINPQMLSEWLVPMVLYQGGIFATIHCHPCQLLYSPLPFDAIVQGTGGEFARGADWVSPGDLRISNLTTEFIMRRLSSRTAQCLNMEQLWKREFRFIGMHAPREHLHSLLAGYKPKDSPIAVMKYLSLNELGRKFLNKAILIARGSKGAYFPYFDHQWVEAIASIPISERVNNRIQTDLIKRLCPEIKDIPYTHDPFPLLAPLWKILMRKGYRVVKRRTLQKLQFTNINPDEVPSTYYFRWSRKEMYNTFTELLYNPHAAFRTYLNWKTVETLLNQHFTGKKNWEILVAALTVFEISHKLWVAPYKPYTDDHVIPLFLPSDLKKAI